jgi:serine/threonine protein kinase
LAVIEVVKASSFSDDDKRLRGNSDLGIASDQELLTSNPNFGQNSRVVSIYPQRGGAYGSSPPEAPNAPAFNFGSYFSEFPRGNNQWPADLSQATRRSGFEILDPETSFNDFKISSERLAGGVDKSEGELNWMDLVIKRDSREKLQQLDESATHFENNVSNAAFIDYTTNSNSVLVPSSTATSGCNSNSNGSPITNEKTGDPFTTEAVLSGAQVELKKSSSDSYLAGKETMKSAVILPVSLQKQPFSYKDALEKKVDPATLGKSDFVPIKRVDDSTLRSQSSGTSSARAASAKVVDLEEGKKLHGSITKRKSSYLSERNAKEESQQKSGHMPNQITAAIKIPLHQQNKNQVMRNYESTLRHDALASSSSSTSSNRVPASPSDICKIISKSFEARGANPVELLGPPDISTIPRHLSGTKISTSRSNHEQEQQPIPDTAIAYSTWIGNFRMPTAYAPKATPNVFKFPVSPRSDPIFLSQLEEFRKSLQMFEGKPIEGCKFKDFQPKLNFYGTNMGAQKISDKKLYTTSPSMKVFDAPPIRAWIPVRCDALGVDLRHERNVDGHAGKGGGKAQVSVVYDANKSSGDKKVLYIRKEYYDLEYFTNEYNFLQFADHQHIPKPLCVMYDPYPTIVMDYVPGERVHVAFYHLGMSFREEYHDEPITPRKKMSIALSKVLAKILVTLKYIHSIGFIHSDLKPENIIYDLSSGRIAIIDFDLSVSAPYAFTGRGTEATVAPEVYGLLKGPVHFGIDWWAYGSTAAMMIAAALAGLCYDIEFVVEDTMNYVPFKYIRSTNQYEMTPIPKYFSPVMRSFLYPFFNPDPSKRVFSEANAYNWIRSHVMFECIENWQNYEHVNLGVYASLSPIQIGFMKFSSSPRLLKPLTRVSKLFTGISNGWSQMFGVWGGGSSVIKSDSTVVSKAAAEEEEEEDYDDEEESIEEQENDYAEEMFVLDDAK